MCHFVRMKGIKGRGGEIATSKMIRSPARNLLHIRSSKLGHQKLHDASHAINPAANP